ncbi:MAG: AmmeMemoRadiSam system protein A, partial [Caldisericia bacterium]|nr:AmmeMemoRadiSam system protein A [Caldisericia bacterium]
EEAGECGYRSILTLLTLMPFEKYKAEVLSYEGPFGVGYLVAVVERREMHKLVKLAKNTVELYVKEREIFVPDLEEYKEYLNVRKGAFVTLHKGKELRGCIGTYLPTRKNLIEEIIMNAISAATEDPRFYPVSPKELDEITYSVDVLEEPEEVKDISELDPNIYGVIVVKGFRRGLLLPQIEGVDTVEEQLRIAKLKAGIHPQDKDVKIYKFKVTRYF